MEFHHPSVPKDFPLYAHVAQEPQAEKTPHGSSPSLPIIPQLEKRAPSSESIFTLNLAQRQSSYDRILSDITNMTPNFSGETNQKMFFPIDIGQKFEANAQNNIENSNKPGPIMVMEQYKLPPIPEISNVKESILKGNDRKSIDPQGYAPSLETIGTSHDELRSPRSEKVIQKTHHDLARPSHSLWSSVSHIEDHEAPFDTTEIQETKNIFTFETNRSSRKETVTLINEIEDLFEEEEHLNSDIRQATVFKKLLTDLQRNRVRVTRIKVETVVGRVRTHRASISKDYAEQRGSTKRVDTIPHELDIDIEGVQSQEDHQAGASTSKIAFEKAREIKNELANEFEKLKGATKELLETEDDSSNKEDSEKAPKEAIVEALVPEEEEADQSESEDQQEYELRKEDDNLEEAEDEGEMEKTDEKSLEQETFLEKDEIKKRVLEEAEEITKPIQVQETEVIELKEKDQRPSAWMARLVTIGIAGLLSVILWFQLQGEFEDL